jgi:hypothetical protein
VPCRAGVAKLMATYIVLRKISFVMFYVDLYSPERRYGETASSVEEVRAGVLGEVTGEGPAASQSVSASHRPSGIRSRQDLRGGRDDTKREQGECDEMA